MLDMATTSRVLAILTVLTALSLAQEYTHPRISYPPTLKDDIVDDYHGTKVPAPYRWMEDLDSKQVTAWVAAENKVTFDYLATLPMRDHFRRRITELWDYAKITIPVHKGERYFYSKNSGLQRQFSLYMRPNLTAPATLVIDPNTLSPDGSISLSQWTPSNDGRLVAYGLSQGGADWRTIHVRDVDTGKDYPDEVQWARFTDISWTADNKGFFYSRFPEPPKGKVLEAAVTNQALYYHRVGTPQAKDPLIYERKDLPSWFLSGEVTEDGRYVIIPISKGVSRNRLYYIDLKDPAKPVVDAPVKALIEDDDAEFVPFGNRGPVLYLRTDRSAPNRKIVAIDLGHPAPADWKTIVPERKQAIENASLIGGRLVLEYLIDAQSRISLFALDGAAQGDITLPGTGTVTGIDGREDAPEIFYAFSSPLFPATVYVYHPETRKQAPFEVTKTSFDVTQYETKELFATSKDGTRVPFFLTCRKGIALDGSHPTMITGYGGFAISNLPTYRSDVPAWLELGGIWVVANIRGGAEYGEAWHLAGRLEKKQNVFDDMIAVAEQLVNDHYTKPQKLGIVGGSNGGLLVGAVEEQRPDLFAVALPAVGVMDMLRYDKFTGGVAWVSEYGSSSNPEDFKYLIKYSPLQNVKPGTCYPATLVTTADHDDRVVPSHSFKFTAAMQAAQSCANPILIRVETQGSHGYRPTDKRIAELADQWAFAAAATGMQAQ